jgi:pimeloyl-ACP methyl ester carboxylesterase
MSKLEGSVVIVETWPVSTREAETVPVAVKYRESGKDLLVLMHGLGCAKESFDGAFAAESLARYSLLTFDLPEHGDSGSTGPHPDIDSAAEVVSHLLRDLPHRRVHLVCHSMSGAIGLVAAQDLPGLASYISVEGNLVAEDCGLVSRGIAEQDVNEFVRTGFASFVEFLESSTEHSHTQWAQWYKRCRPRGLHSLASSLVEWCDNDKLISILFSLGTGTYIHGGDSEVGHLVDRLGTVPRHAITGSGHFPMLDKPAEFYALIGKIVGGAPTTGSQVLPAFQSV